MNKEKPRIGISAGDINGIGMEVIIKALADNRIFSECTPVVYSSSKIASFYKKQLNLPDFNFNAAKDASQINPKTANLVNCWEEEVALQPGKSTPEGGKYALKSLQAVVEDLKAGKVDMLVTAPLNKENIQSDQFRFPGHTEYLTQEAGVNDSLMLLVSDDLRVGVITGHVPLSKVAGLITPDLIASKVKILNRSLQIDFGIRKPRIAVLGLNPHAGDNGVIGNEENTIIAPAVNELRAESDIMVFGPYPADGFFGSGNFKNFDGILSMYHDQGLAPFKALSFGSGVNFTAGLPIVRTSPDHGTGYDIAGKNLASEESFRNAIYLACDIYNNRQQQKEWSKNPLKVTEQKRER